MNVAEYIWDYLKDKTDHVFMLPGGGAMYLVDALGRSGIPYTVFLHEQAAGFAALAYAQAKGFAVCLVTSGPGATNAITPCIAAYQDSAPVLFISGQAKTSVLYRMNGCRQSGSQQAPILRMVYSDEEPIVKYGEMVSRPGRMPFVLKKAVHMATTPRKAPSWLDIPVDIQGAQI